MGVMRLLIVCLERVPLAVSAALLRAVVLVWWGLLPVRKKLAVKNFSNAFPSLAPGPSIRGGMRSMLLGYVEFFRAMRGASVDWRFRGFGPLVERHRRGEGSLVVTGHSGAWELMGLAASRDLGLRVTVIARRPSSVAVREKLAELRRDAGFEVLAPEGSFFMAAKAFDEGRIVVFLLDQRHNTGEPMEFFGRLAWTSKALALLALRKKAPVFGAWAHRRGIGQHDFVLYGAIPLGGGVVEDTQKLVGFTEDRIRERPGEWLWLHDRWKVPKEAA